LLLQALKGDWPDLLLSRGSKAAFDEYFFTAYEAHAVGIANTVHCSERLIDWKEVALARAAIEPLIRSGKAPGFFGQSRAMWIPVGIETWLSVCGGSG
jgi:hypothetical protein